jgi:hypothetical protein
MSFSPQTRFSMCSLYPRHERAMCACFSGKDARVVDDLVALHSEALLWSGAGSGVISLADLEAELKGRRAWDRQGTCDREFLKACHGRGIKVFAVVFTAQGYEVAIELNQDESEIISFGKVLGKGKRGNWGLNEFYQDRYPKIYKSCQLYLLPERRAKMEQALASQHFLDQAACRDLHGDKSLCYWVTSSGLERDLKYTNYFMCKNRPVWMEHLKTIVEMQIDAGFDGIQFDEPALAMEPGGTRAGFCPHCQDRFRKYMVEHHGEKFRNFDYAGLLRKKGAGIPSELAYFRGMPYWQDWKRSLLIDAKRNFSELTGHARAYAKTKGREVQVAANFAFWMPHHLALAEQVDIFSLEYHPAIPPAGTNIIYAEIGAALDEKKPITMVPDIAFAAHLRERAKAKNPDGAGADVNILRYLIAEASFARGDFMVPYSCLGLTGDGAYFPPIAEISGYLKFVKDIRETWRSAKNISQAAVVLSFPSYFWTFDFLNLPGRHFASLLNVTRLLQNEGIQYRLVIWGDEEFMKDRGEPTRDELLILPNVSHITDAQGTRTRSPGAKILKGENLAPQDLREAGLKPMVSVSNPAGLSPLLRLAESSDKLLIKLLNRNYRCRKDVFMPVRGAELAIEKNFGRAPKVFRMSTPEGRSFEVRARPENNRIFPLPEFQIYACLEEIE